jgi:hypothetical protein
MKLDRLERHPWLFILKHGSTHGLGSWTGVVYCLLWLVSCCLLAYAAFLWLPKCFAVK